MSTGAMLWRSAQPRGQTPEDDRQDVQAEVGGIDPGQGEEPRVVDDEGRFFSRTRSSQARRQAGMIAGQRSPHATSKSSSLAAASAVSDR